MIFPFKVYSNLDDSLHQNFIYRFTNGKNVRKTVWRRTQSESNKELSLWGKDGVYRRRLIYVNDVYDLKDNDFYLKKSLIHINYKAPIDEIKNYVEKLMTFKWNCKVSNGVIVLQKGDLKVNLIQYKLKHLFEGKGDVGYWNLDIVITANMDWHYTDVAVAFNVLNIAGIREKSLAGNPTEISKENLTKFFPAQVTLGCGPSIEAGIPPLHFLHDVYCLKKKDGIFVLRPEDDNFVIKYLEDPYQKYVDMTYIHKMCLLAKPTNFYYGIRNWYNEGKLVGPVLNNNFDGICCSLGIPEYCLRVHDMQGWYPETQFHPDAKSLFVIGCHADRRNVEKSARKKNLNIVYIDPCGYEENNVFVPYPLESPQNNDFIIKLKAVEISA